LGSNNSVKSILKKELDQTIEGGGDEIQHLKKLRKSPDLDTCSIDSEYEMVSDIFNYKQLIESRNFGIKIYKNATYKGLINEHNKREGFGVYLAENNVYEGEWLKDKRNG
jgi:hypothetical protein